MECNVGKKEQAVRFVAGLVSAALGFFVHFAFYIVALILILTAFFKFCPLYKALGISTCEEHKEAKGA